MRHGCLLCIGLLTLGAAGGCQLPLKTLAKTSAGKIDSPNAAHATSHRREAYAEQATPIVPPGVEPLSEPTREEAFSQVLADLQEIGQQNPTAQQALLGQLDQTDPAHWASLVQRMRSDLGYHQQLAASQPGHEVMQASSQSEPQANPYAPQPTPPGMDPASRPPARWGGSPANQPPSEPEKNTRFAETPPANSSASYSPAPGSQQSTRRIDLAVQPTSSVTALPGTDANAEQAPYTAADHPYPEMASASPESINKPHASISWQSSLQESVAQLSNELSDHPQTVYEAYDHVRLRLMQLAAGNLDDAAAPAPGLTATEQQYWSNQLLTLSTLLDQASQPDARRRAAAAGMHLQQATTAIEQLGSLTVRNVVFCEEVYGFGAYKPLGSAHFKPGQEVKVYAEVENFKTVSTAQGEHTSLATSYQVLDQHGGRVDGGEVPVVNDYCARRRRDFHIQYGVTLPKGIYPGTYVLELTLTDQLGDKIGHGSIQFEIDGGDKP